MADGAAVGEGGRKLHFVQSRVSGQLCGRWGGLGLLLGRGKEYLALIFTEGLCRLLGTPTKEDTNQDTQPRGNLP